MGGSKNFAGYCSSPFSFLFFFFLGPGKGGEDVNDEEGEDKDEEEEEFNPVHAHVINALDQVRGKSETVYEPFVLQKDTKVYFIFWKCPGINVKVTPKEMGLDVDVEVTPPTEQQLKDMGLDLPSIALKTMESRFRVTLDFRVAPSTLKGEAMPPFVVFTLDKFRAPEKL